MARLSRIGQALEVEVTMNDRTTTLNSGLRIAQMMLNVLLAVVFIWLGATSLVSPSVPAEVAVENTMVGVALLATAAVLIYDVFRAFSGGVLLLVWAVVFSSVFNGFHLSEALMRSRPVGYHPFWSAVTALLLALGLMSLWRARINGRRASDLPD